MAKTAKFDRQKVIDKATNLYWKKGFHATSMRNLQDEIDMRPGSIYSAFGSKEGLFKEALRHYTDMGLALIERYKNELTSPSEILQAFVKAQVIDTQDNAPNGMCMLAKTIGELTEENQELLETTKNHLNEISNEFSKLIQEAQSLGEIDADKDPENLASHLQIQIAGLRTFAKMNNDKALLETKIDDIFTHYPF
ncbi:TetR family transcriptional regulator [Vibrio sp. UCD-FRSSP16_10]|uniref:TetR/AcrR family transcriptional regulator n=1 Tax=unclassified Vibrio TaxID=2614977 RepID=UPI0007FD3032|nr:MULTISPECIES: TetR/AcrR family transcriptional regulator [unclassified Vibrio]OBT13931.1 TetR family transcriptional regulator [Vibrio sp. UCD-FRSSP16_30]OBT22812.1 TetR family transcriptional regulator [Vibrio sp. UCD-FRSSP16_10]